MLAGLKKLLGLTYPGEMNLRMYFFEAAMAPKRSSLMAGFVAFIALAVILLTVYSGDRN
jgi:hypothetical protein